MKNLHWPRTVQLILTVQFPFEIIFILQNNAVPILEHLYITIEQEQLRRKPYLDASQPQIQFCENDIRQMTDATRLQTLILRHLSLYNVTILIRSLNMPLLKKLILVDIFDESKLLSNDETLGYESMVNKNIMIVKKGYYKMHMHMKTYHD